VENPQGPRITASLKKRNGQKEKSWFWQYLKGKGSGVKDRFLKVQEPGGKKGER